MKEEFEHFIEIGQSLTESEQGNLFGKTCFKINRKAFICFFEDAMVFKLTGDAHREALDLENAKLFDPSGKGRPMKEWVQVPFQHHNVWEKFAHEAIEYVNG